MEKGREFCVFDAHRGTPSAMAARPGLLQCETSGTTATAKRLRRSQKSWRASFAIDRELWRLSRTDRVMVMGALHHSLALYGMALAQYCGAATIACDMPRPNAQFTFLALAKASVLIATPTQLRQFSAVLTNPFTHMRLVLIGGGIFDRAARDVAVRLFPKAQIATFYGAGETSFITIAETGTDDGSVGTPYPGVEIRIRDDSARNLPDGVSGTIWVRSPYLFEEYAIGEDPDLKWDDDFLAFGEIGRLDSSGKLHLSGRSSRMFTVADRNVFPEVIETFLLSLSGVTGAVVLPVKDDRRGAIPVAIMSGLGVDVSRTRDLCRCRFGSEAAPRRIVILEKIPLLSSGKPNLRALAKMLERGA